MNRGFFVNTTPIESSHLWVIHLQSINEKFQATNTWHLPKTRQTTHQPCRSVMSILQHGKFDSRSSSTIFVIFDIKCFMIPKHSEGFDDRYIVVQIHVFNHTNTLFTLSPPLTSTWLSISIHSSFCDVRAAYANLASLLYCWQYQRDANKTGLQRETNLLQDWSLVCYASYAITSVQNE